MILFVFLCQPYTQFYLEPQLLIRSQPKQIIRESITFDKKNNGKCLLHNSGSLFGGFCAKGVLPPEQKTCLTKKISGIGRDPPPLCGKPTNLTPEKFPPQEVRGVLHEI